MSPDAASGLIDTHCHLGHIDRATEDVLADAAAAGVGLVVDIGMGTAESAASVSRAESSGGRVLAAVGIHPNDLAEFRADPAASIARLRELAASPAVVAIGETGLDFYRERETPETQEAAFEAQIALARETGRALVIHCRDAHARVLEVLDAARPPGRVVMHCFSGDADYARACGERGYYCSFAGNLTYPRNADLREAVKSVPTDLLLVETDAPFLAPHPHRGKGNEPSFLPLTVAALAAALGLTDDEAADLLATNAHRAFQIPSTV